MPSTTSSALLDPALGSTPSERFDRSVGGYRAAHTNGRPHAKRRVARERETGGHPTGRGGVGTGTMSRRTFLFAAGAALALPSIACGASLGRPPVGAGIGFGDGRLSWRPDGRVPSRRPPGGLMSLGIAGERDSLLYLPASMPRGKPVPLVVAFHGAGRTASAESGLRRFRAASDETGVPVASVASRGPTWDAILSGYGPDVEMTDRTFEAVNAVVGVEDGRVGLAGYSDGATYALSLGITNGDVITHVIACSPGFTAEAARRGKPRIFISHGTSDPVLPIDETSRKIVPALREDGYDVTYVEFPGRHEVPPDIALEAFEWFVAIRTPASDSEL
jgi:phospholipase/carboxylesterase